MVRSRPITRISIANSVTDQIFAFTPALKALGPLNCKAVLDYGCGPGVFSRQMGNEGAHVVGMDTAADAIELAKRRRRCHLRWGRSSTLSPKIANGDVGGLPYQH